MIKEKIRNVGAFTIGPVIGALFSFITVPIITHFINPSEYGKTSMFVLTQSILAMVIFLGFDQAFVREYHEHRDDHDKLLFNAMLIPILNTAFIEIIMFFFAKQISVLLFDTMNEVKCVYSLMILLPFLIVESFSFLKVRMQEKGFQYSLFLITQKTLILLLTIVLFKFYQKSFEAVIYGAVFAEIINAILLFLFVLKPKFFSIDKAIIRKMFKFGFPLIFSSIIGLVLSSTDKIMLRSLCTYNDLGLYSSAFKIVSVLSIIQQCFTLVWTPIALRWFAEKKDNKSYLVVGDTVLNVMSVVCLCILLCKDFVVFLLGNSYSEAIYIIPFLLLYPVMYTVSEVTSLGISFSRKTGYNILISAISGGVNIFLNFLLIPVFGGKGAAIATGISYIIFFFTRTYISRALWWKFKMRKYLINFSILLINCILHSFSFGLLPYVISALSLIFIGVCTIGDVKKVISVIKINEKNNEVI